MKNNATKYLIGLLIVLLLLVRLVFVCLYDARAELLYHEPQDNGLILEPLDAIVPALMVNGELYCYVGESLTGDRCGMMDGAITSTVESWKMPVKDDQSNFGEYSYQYGNEGFIEVLQDGTWYTYGIRSGEGRVRYNDWWYDLKYISEDTLEWLAWYNEQPDAIRELVYVPEELRDPYQFDDKFHLELDQRKLAVLDAVWMLEYRGSSEEHQPEYTMVFDDANSFGINETEMLIWKDGQEAEIPDELYEEMYQTGLLEYYQLADGRWKYHGLEYDKMVEMTGRTPNAIKDVRYVVLTNDPNVTFEEITAHLISSSMSDRIPVEETKVVEMEVQ